MDEFLLSMPLGIGHALHITTLSRVTVIESGAEHLGTHGYFLVEEIADASGGVLAVLGKTPSFDAALRLAEILRCRLGPRSSVCAAE